MSQKGSRLDGVFAAVLDRRRARNQLRQLTTVPDGMVDFSSNAYLSLSSQPAVQQAFLARLHAAAASPCPNSTTATSNTTNTGSSGNGSSSSNIINTSQPTTPSPSPPPPPPPLLGAGGSRLLDGNSARAEALERAVAAFHRAPAGLLFNSALDANVGLFASAPQPGDAVVYDALVHASVHDGMRLSRVPRERRRPFAHGRVWAAAAAAGPGGNGGEEVEEDGQGMPLEGVLRSLLSGPDGRLFRNGQRNVFVAVEGVYSMDGDVAPLREIVECVERTLPKGNGYIIVDEAHSTGIFGERGRGLVCELGLEDRVWARVLGFGKAMGCSGGMVLCSPTTRSYLINYARTFIYTTAMAFPSLASIETTYQFLMTGQAEPLLNHLRLLIGYAHQLLLALCARRKPPAAVLRVNTELPRSPIIPVFTSRPRDLAKHCQQRGFMVRPIVAPTVPKGTERIRVCLHAGNTKAEVEGLIAALDAWVVASTASSIGMESADGEDSSASGGGSWEVEQVGSIRKTKL